MAASMWKVVRCACFHRKHLNSAVVRQLQPVTTYCTEYVATKGTEKSEDEVAEDYDPFTSSWIREKEKNESFATMFRHSPFVSVGDLRNKIVAGRIFQVINDDLYIDFGGKFMCCCPRPTFRAQEYTKGKRVRLYLHDFEMASTFMGSDKAVTLLEADCTLLGLFQPYQPMRPSSDTVPSDTEEGLNDSHEPDQRTERTAEKKDTSEDIVL